MNKCDICGYEDKSDIVAYRRPDGVVRCRICADKAVFGRFVADREVLKMDYDETVAHADEFREHKTNQEMAS